MPRRILEWKPMGMRIRGRPGKDGLKMLRKTSRRWELRGWGKMSEERTEWKKFTEKAKTHSGL